mmetsp:Transcript_35556/g.106132  ORF Transcript_35556/g.106132 Transcript_35556/m.106132 type:complete len:242 (-) Transcript_35556:77-802(-)|eukprot:CAMPEP_0113525358 /NCGR_PEP_ID=MMETSP0015_2-20120614/113_1 /TAXON_ID=2838 /ORGANISM="Odontella" /LENGTH=241 /DNA_ID=CAMNT_0000423507 /DNA_START=394 /DNA_END=1119 /DNA_ORIENTATION=- /assembly_acc=CAM_ASM_000160
MIYTTAICATCVVFLNVEGSLALQVQKPISRTRRTTRSIPSDTLSSRFMAGGDFFDEISDPSSQTGSASQTTGDPVAEAMAASSPFEDHIPRLNIVTLTGRVGNDPEPRYFDDGKVVLNLSLAVQRKYHPLERKVRNIKYGEEETDWFPLELWGRDAEFASKFVDKGARVGITGSLEMDSWEDRNTGEPRKKHKVLVKHLDILETRAEAEARRGRSRGGGYGGYYEEDDRSNSGSGGFFDD